MSRFLGPIHYWLYNKINVLEDIEKNILVNLVDPKDQPLLKNELVASFGPYLDKAPLDSLIDQDNIHGWLQGKIKIAESRQSKLIHGLQEKAGDAIYEEVAKIYAEMGKKQGEAIEFADAETPEMLFRSLDNFLLEGMPCDRVNAVTENTPDKLEWQKDRCVHAAFWNEGGTDVKNYYNFRQAFSKAFVEAANNIFSYEFELKNDLQYHKIFKK